MAITQQATREIIEDFAREIQKKKITASPAESTRIDFRNGIAENRKEIVYKVPLDLLRFRKENGRISSSVKSYERTAGPLIGTDRDAQLRLHQFLREKDPEKTDELKQLLRADGQREPGIITADGFLINGNRRKVALDELQQEHPAEDAFQTMKVVILPGSGDEGGPPTLKEIEQIENRYQLQTEGKADYYGFDAALSIRDKISSGYTLEQQMRDDPQYKLMEEAEFRRAVKKRQKDLLEPLDCVEEYLDAIDRPGEYSAVSRGLGDPEGRWQAFIDLSKAFWTRAKTPRGLDKMGIDETEAGDIMQAAYSVIRLRTVPDFGKLHDIMRDFPKYAEHGKARLLELAKNTKHDLPLAETVDAEGKQLSREAIEEKWKNKYRTEITRRLVQAREASQTGSEKNAPLTLLSDALKKLTHDNMIVENIPINDLNEALAIANDLCSESENLKTQIYQKVKTAQKVGMLKPSDQT
ncbi:MAG: hypothetical protein OXH94_15700 [Rhodospirillales bacterium]|nr:hypothetical protein [Rhodospirillales bacterium]